MVAVTVRNISDETHRALKRRAKQHGRSTEAEIRQILEHSVKSENHLKLGTLLQKVGKKVGMTAKESQKFESALKRDKTSSDPIEF